MDTVTDVSITGFGVVADESEFFIRALEAKSRAQLGRDGEARYLADAVIEVPAYPNLDIAQGYYRRAVAGEGYARAVYDVEVERRGFERSK